MMQPPWNSAIFSRKFSFTGRVCRKLPQETVPDLANLLETSTWFPERSPRRTLTLKMALLSHFSSARNITNEWLSALSTHHRVWFHYFNRIIHHTTSKTGTSERASYMQGLGGPGARQGCNFLHPDSWRELVQLAFNAGARAGWASHLRYPYPQALATGMHPPSASGGADFQGSWYTFWG